MNLPHKNSSINVAEILDKYVSNYNLDVVGFRERGQQSVIKAVLTVLLEVIGEDEPDGKMTDGVLKPYYRKEWRAVTRNQLRATQRTALIKVIGAIK